MAARGYAASAMRSPRTLIHLIARQETPLCAGPSLTELRRSFVTPTDAFYVQSHGSVPVVDTATYRLKVDGLVKRTLELSLDDLKRDFRKATVMATLQCAGNRREELARIAPISGEALSGGEAIGNAVWGGVPLREVLAAAGLRGNVQHIAFTGLDQVEQEGRRVSFGGSIPMIKALGSEVLLAYEMNGEQLPPLHGFPLQLVVPGYIGARSIKWLAHIAVQDQPSDNFFQTKAFKLFPPEVSAQTAPWESEPGLEGVLTNSVICSPEEGEQVRAGEVTVRGYALVRPGHALSLVEVSPDGGDTWVMATVTPERDEWTWRFWEATLVLEPRLHELAVRAWDSASTQPPHPRIVWNFKGYMNNAWHRVRVEVAAP